MTKEEYMKQIKRYFDSINPERGEAANALSCHGVLCGKCIFYKQCCKFDEDADIMLENAFEVIETIKKWVKEHPPITNKNKMEQVFGVKIDSKCECPPGIEMCGSPTCKECRKWWNEKYQEPKKDV